MRNGYRFALIGEDISYSKSPAIFAAIFRLANVSGQFDLVSIKSHELQGALKQLVLDGYRGFSVTIPHKQSVIEFLDDVDPISHKVGAVNCIVVSKQQFLGFNTDCHGFSYSLNRLGPARVGESALILGAGGSARAVGHVLFTEFGIRNITVCGRSDEHLKKCVACLQSRYEKLIVSGVLFADLRAHCPNRHGIVVNCTPLGGFRFPNDSPFGYEIPCAQGGIYCDLNYNRPNRAVQVVREHGLTAIDGALMLVAQAVKAFQIWTDIEVPVEPVYRAVFGN